MRKNLILSAFAAAFLISACSSKNSNIEQDLQKEFLAKKKFDIEKISFVGKNLNSAGFEAKPNIIFEDGKFYGFSGCNRFFGAYESVNKSIKFNENGGSTKMLCYPSEVMEFEQILLSNLIGEFKITQNKEQIVLDSEQMKIYLK